jgi:hypothetical protein
MAAVEDSTVAAVEDSTAVAAAMVAAVTVVADTDNSRL